MFPLVGIIVPPTIIQGGTSQLTPFNPQPYLDFWFKKKLYLGHKFKVLV